MSRGASPAILVTVLALLVPGRCGGQGILQDAVSRVPDPGLRAQLQELYSGWSWRLVWRSADRPLPRSDTLVAWLDGAAGDGLEPSDYDVPGLRAAQSENGDSATAATDVRLSLAFLRIGRDLSAGRVSPPLVDSLWDGVAAPNVMPVLRRAIDRDDVTGALRSLRPPDGRYAALREALLRYRAVAERGGWPVVVEGADLRVGDRGSRVAALRARLAATEALAGSSDSGGDTVFDRDVDLALRRFQARMGLPVDGVAGPVTRAALNVPVSRRLLTIELNLERWRWSPRRLGTRYILVNIPAYTLTLHDSSAVVTFRAIVGRRDWPTPITSAWLDGVTFGPEWNVPRDIALQEVVPLERGRPGYLRREGFQVIDTGTRAPVDPDSVAWAEVDSARFPYRLVQESGPANPLGAIRFDVRDPFNVAIHDTPQHVLFADRVRVFSHGCVRVDRAAVLAVDLLPGWSMDDVQAAMRAPEGRTVVLDRRLRVLLTYQTAWVEPDGGVAFRDDVYGWDDELADALLRMESRPFVGAAIGDHR